MVKEVLNFMSFFKRKLEIFYVFQVYVYEVFIRGFRLGIFGESGVQSRNLIYLVDKFKINVAKVYFQI